MRTEVKLSGLFSSILLNISLYHRGPILATESSAYLQVQPAHKLLMSDPGWALPSANGRENHILGLKKQQRDCGIDESSFLLYGDW